MKNFLIFLIEGKGRNVFMKTMYILVPVLFVMDIFTERHHHNFFMDKFYFFYSFFGFFACLLIIYVSKYLGKAGLQKPEDYYDSDYEGK